MLYRCVSRWRRAEETLLRAPAACRAICGARCRSNMGSVIGVFVRLRRWIKLRCEVRALEHPVPIIDMNFHVSAGDFWIQGEIDVENGFRC